MVPATVIGFSKRVPAGGDTICGKFVPGGTDIMVNHYEMLRNKAVFGEDADMFRPERFIECHDEDTKARMFKVIDLSFGHGRWMCLGKVLAWMELNKLFVEVSVCTHLPTFFFFFNLLLLKTYCLPFITAPPSASS